MKEGRIRQFITRPDRSLRQRVTHLVRADREGVLPIHRYKPEGDKSESREWFQTTLQDRSEFPEQKGVLVFAAHQDDETEFAGATIAQLSQKGYAVTVVHMTDGRYGAMSDVRPENMSEHVAKRLTESVKAAEILGVQRVINLGIKDTYVSPSDEELQEHLVTLIRQENPSVILTQSNASDPFMRDGHPDHQDTFQAITKAAFRAHLHMHRERRGLSSIPGTPTVYTWDPQGLVNVYGTEAPYEMLVNAEGTQQQKQKAFMQYQSQIYNMDPEKVAVGQSYVTERVEQDSQRGQGIFAFAEAFTQYKPAQFPQKNILAEMVGKENILLKGDGFYSPIQRIQTKEEILGSTFVEQVYGQQIFA